MCLVALARYFLLKKKKIKFFIIDERRLELYKKMPRKKVNEYFLNFKKIFNIFMNNEVKIEFIKFNKFLRLKHNKENFIIFEKKTINRQRFDIYCCFLINHLVSSEGKNF